MEPCEVRSKSQIVADNHDFRAALDEGKVHAPKSVKVTQEFSSLPSQNICGLAATWVMDTLWSEGQPGGYIPLYPVQNCG
jgi:hypothetical protein